MPANRLSLASMRAAIMAVDAPAPMIVPKPKTFLDLVTANPKFLRKPEPEPEPKLALVVSRPEFEPISDEIIAQLDADFPPPVFVDIDQLDLSNAELIVNTTCRPRLDLNLLICIVERIQCGDTPKTLFKRGHQLRDYKVEDFVLTLSVILDDEMPESALSKYKAPIVEPEAIVIDESWWHALEKRGDYPDPSADNCYRALTTCPALMGLIGYDNFTQEAVRLRDIDGAAIEPIVWKRMDTTRVWYYLLGNVHMHNVPRKFVEDALDLIRWENQVDTLKMYVEGLPAHDGVPRLDSWLIDYAGADDDEVNRIAGRKFLIGMIERALYPGIDCKRSLILLGKQDIGKSGLCKILAGYDDWHDNRIRDISNEVTIGNQLRGKWLIEIAEGVGLGRADRDQIKGFLSTRIDKFTPKYSNDETRVPRRVCLVLTTNEVEVLNDPTGHSRWMPVEVGQIDFAGITANREQILAEALVAVLAGETNRLSPEQSTLMEDRCWMYTVEDPLEQSIRAVLSGVVERTTLATVCERVGISFTAAGAPTRRVKDVLMKFGWTSKTINGVRYYARTETSIPPVDAKLAKHIKSGMSNIVAMRGRSTASSGQMGKLDEFYDD